MRKTIDIRSVQVKRELMLVASSNLLFVTISLLTVIGAIVVAFWDISDRIFLLSWFLVLAIILIMGNINAKIFLFNESTPSTESLDKVEQYFKVYTYVTAIIISIGIIVLFPQDKPFYQAFLIIVVSGISAGAVMSLSSYKKIVRNYLIIILLPLIFIIFFQGTHLYTLLALLIVLFLFMLIIFSRKYNDEIMDIITSLLLYEEAQKKIKLSKDRFSTIFQQTPVGIFTYNTDLIILESNNTLSELLQAPAENVIGVDLKQLPDQSFRPCLDVSLAGEKGFYEGKYHTQISDQDAWINMQTVPMHDIHNNIEGGLAIVSDITQRLESEKIIRHQAYYDNLTNLANRLTFHDRLEQQLSSLIRHKRFGAVIFIDIDKFKLINDSYGHHVGDEVLKTFSSRIVSVMRKEDTVARLGGDEFVVLLSELGNSAKEAKEYATNIAKKIHDVMRNTFVIEEYTLDVQFSLGVTIIGNKDETIDDILKHADTAMYKAKKEGRNCTRFYEH